MYDAAGRLLSITNRSGIAHTLQYDSCNRLASVTHSFGERLLLNYNFGCAVNGATGKVASITLPNNSQITYGYGSDGSLSSVLYPDTTSVSYQYSGGALSVRIDESNVQYANWGYDAQGRAASSQHAGGADATTVLYTLMCGFCNVWEIGSATITDALNTPRTYSYTWTNHSSKLSQITQPAASGTGTVSQTYGYDGNGNLSSKTDFNGVTTRYTFDLTRNLELSRTEAYGTPRARTITTTWHPTFRLPATVTEPNRKTTYTYDALGNMLTKKRTDTSVTPNVSRTWTYTYNSFGQVLTEDGPRTGVTDVTTYTYYSCTTGVQCGQLNTVSNAVGQVTTFNTYNAHGQPLTITDPNGVVTTLTYDTRLRMTSRQVG